MRRWSSKSGFKVGCLTVKGGWKLDDLNGMAVAGMGHVAVKCIDMTRNTDCEGRLLRPD